MEKFECNNCSKEFTEDQLINPVPDLEQRVDPGGPMPAGECPECGALAYKAIDYKDMTQTEFDSMLCEIVGDQPALTLIQIPGVYEVLAEHFNNEVLDYWKEKKLSERI